MTHGRGHSEWELPEAPPGYGDTTPPGRKCISVIGINDYRRWPSLRNAVSDAEGVLAAFEHLGFVRVGAPLLDNRATREAISYLPVGLKPELRCNDSLVVFFAGHGHTARIQFQYGRPESKGYLIPFDADPAGSHHPDDREHTWHRIDHWLTTIAELPPRHVLVILDSCCSGIALSRAIQHRARGVRDDGTPVPIHERRSRWVLTSALGNQKAMDGGPIEGHSVFTGYLIKALRGAVSARGESQTASVQDIAAYVQNGVLEYSKNLQEPDHGCLEYDDGGKLVLSLAQAGTSQNATDEHRDAPPTAARSTSSTGEARQPARRVERIEGRTRSTADHTRGNAGRTGGSASTADQTRNASTAAEGETLQPKGEVGGSGYSARSDTRRDRGRLEGRSAPEAIDRSREAVAVRDRSEGWELDLPVEAALDRQGERRRRGEHVLTIVAGDAMAAQISWGTWAARHGYLTLATPSVGLDATVADLLAQTPWLRCVPEARRRLAAAARIDVQAVDASLDARPILAQQRWVDDLAPFDPHARVAGWLLSSLRRPTACIQDPSTAPVKPADLLAVACDLASPTTVLLFHPEPDERWLERAIVTAAELIPYLPAHSVAVTAPDDLVARVLDSRRRGSAFSMARQGLVKVESRARRIPGRARHSTMRVLFDALARDPRTRGRFELGGKVASAAGPAIDVALVAHKARIAVELDAWYQFHDPEGYERDRVQDTRLQRAGYFVLRFPSEDVDDRLASTIEQLAIALASRRAVRPLP